MILTGHAAQTGGSTIRPAGFNGIYGLKPTWGAISREGLKQCKRLPSSGDLFRIALTDVIWSDSIMCDTLGLYARSVEDLQLLLEVFDVQDDTKPTVPSLKDCKFGFVKTHVWPKASPTLQDIWEKAKQLLQDAGATIEEVELPAVFENLGEWHR